MGKRCYEQDVPPLTKPQELGVSGPNVYLWTMSRKPTHSKSEPTSAPASPPKDVAWIVTRLGATPAKYVARVYALDEKTAIAKAIEAAGITNPQLQQKLAARRE
jgi:hypothetical protein